LSITPLSTTLYLEGLDIYARRWLKSNASYSTKSLPLEQLGGESELEASILDLAEALIIADSVALKVTGENVVLALLIRTFGAHEVAELIRTRAIVFVGQTNELGHLVDPASLKHLDGSPVAPGNPMSVTFDFVSFEPSAYAGGRLDAEAAAANALRRYRAELKLGQSDIRQLLKWAPKRTSIVRPDRLKDALSRVGKAYADGALSPIGLSPDIAASSNTYQDLDFTRLVSRVAQTETMLEFDLDLYCMPDAWSDIAKFTIEMTSGKSVLRTVDHVMELRGFPDLRSLFKNGTLRFEEIRKLRLHKATASFRRWLWSKADPRDGDQIAREFIAEVSRTKQGGIAMAVRAARVVGLSLLQDHLVGSVPLDEGGRLAVDAGLAVFSDFTIERLKRKPLTAFLDEIVAPAIENSKLERTRPATDAT